MKSLYLLLLAAAVTPAFAQNAPAAPTNNKITYDRVSVGYSSNKFSSGMSFGATALLGSNFLISGGYSDFDLKKNLDGVTGSSTGFGIGYKLTAGPGDLVFSLGYDQLQAAGIVSPVAVALAAEQTSFGLGYRVKLNSAFELSANYTHRKVDTVAGAYDLSSGESAGEGTSENYDDFGISARYYINKSFDITAGYNFSSSVNTWSLSAGYNF
jgi:hypothetical protein